MKRTLGYLLFGVVAYAVFLAAMVPAEFAYDRLKPYAPAVELEAVRGTPWVGHAGRVRIRTHEVRGVDWALDPLGLLAGKLAYTISVDDAEIQGSARVEKGLGSTARLSEVRASLAARRLARSFNTMGIVPEGTAKLDLERIEWDAGRLVAAEGEMRWSRAAIAAPMEFELGEFELSLTTSDNGIEGTLSDSGGALQLQAQVLLQPDGRYTVEGTVKPRPGADPQLAGMVRSMGPAGGDGRIPVRYTGRL